MDGQDTISLDDLEFDSRLGKGNFGEVWKGTYLGTPVAIKKLYFIDDDFMVKYINREASTLVVLHHPHCLQVMGICRAPAHKPPKFGKNADPRHVSEMLGRRSYDASRCDESEEDGERPDVYIITEFVERGDLKALLRDESSSLSWVEKLSMMHDVALALAYLHNKKIMHRDLKSANLLVTRDGRIKVADFGLARDAPAEERETMTIVGTNEWMAPEVQLGDPYELSADVFSYGMVLYEIITRKAPPLRLKKDLFAFKEQVMKEGIPKDTPPKLWELIVSCTAKFPEDRPTMTAVIAKLDEVLEAVKAEESKHSDTNTDTTPSSNNNNNGDGKKKKKDGDKKDKDKEKDKKKTREERKKERQEKKEKKKEEKEKLKKEKADKKEADRKKKKEH